MHPRVLEVTERLIARSRATREAYLALIRGAAGDGPQRGKLAFSGEFDPARVRLADLDGSGAADILYWHSDSVQVFMNLSGRGRPGLAEVEQLLQVTVPLLDALAHAHQRGVLHGDIKPGNVMLSETGVRLFDFGLGQSEAGVLKGLAPLSRTHFGAWTPGYAAPELLAGAPLDP